MIDMEGFYDAASEKFSVPREQFVKIEQEARAAMDRGRMSAREYLERVRAYLRTDADTYTRLFFDFVRINAGLMEIVKELEDCEVVILSNNNPFFAPRKKYEIIDHVDRFILSYEEGMVKPDKRFYELVLEEGTKPKECVYFDDREDFVKPAKELGMHAFVYESPGQVRKELEKLGVL